MLLAAALQAQSQFSQNGEFANLSLSPDANTSITLEVSRNTTASSSTANIVFVSLSFAPDFSSFTFTEIVGNIPPSSFTGQNTQNLSLDLDTSQVDASSGVKITCTFDFASETNTCTTPTDGTISLQFKENDAVRTRVLALGSETTIGPITIRSHQRSDNASANASGTILGLPVSTSSAQVGINHNSSKEIIHN